MSLSLARKYDRPVPRYTSYPTAAQFTPAVGAATFGSWLAEVPPRSVLSLYVHLPFCRSLCWFCGCHTSVLNRPERLSRYLGLLVSEAAQMAAALRTPRLVSLHWGGGTPTILSPEQIRGLADQLRRLFPPAPDAEFSIEVDPRGFTRDKAAALAQAGITRASLGVQDFDPAVQAAVNRIQSIDETVRAAIRLREAGVRSLNVDLLYGLPLQSEAGLVGTVSTVVEAIAPERIALFGYAHVPWMKRHQRLLERFGLPDAEARWRQAEAAAAALLERGYRRVGLDHFARADDALVQAAGSGALHRNFQGYTTDEADVLVGLGASAISTLPQGYAQNASALPDYAAAIESGRWATARGVALAREDRLRRRVIERLMCDLEADLDELMDEDGLPPSLLEADFAKLEPLVADGLVEVRGHRVRITERGRPFARLAAAAFDPYFSANQTRHARAV